MGRPAGRGTGLSLYDHRAFGHLGFEFWNWPEFTEEFGALITQALGGHRTVRVWGKF